MIKQLTELVTLTDQCLPNAEALLGLLSRNNCDVVRLYRAIQQYNFRTEAEAIQKSNVGERTKFRQVAKELLCCLEQMVLHLGTQKLAPLLQSRLQGFQLTAKVKSMVALSCKNSAKRSAEALLRIGLETARPEFVVEAAKALMDYVAVAGDDPKAFDTYYALYREHSEWRAVEERAQIYLERIRLPYIRKKAFQKEVGVLAQQYVEELQPYVLNIVSHQFHLSFFSLQSYRYTAEGMYSEASRVHEEAIRYFSQCAYPCEGALNIFNYLEIVNCLYSGNYRRGGEHFDRSLQFSTVGSINWFGTLELGFYLKMYQEDYLGAAQLYHTAVHHKKFNVLRDTQRETWNILGAYLFIVQQLKSLPLPEALVPKVKSSRFRNEIKDFTQDKTGMNIAILSAGVLLEFLEGKELALWDRISALEKYRERYLCGSEGTHRSQLFIKILVILSKYHHDGSKFLDKAGPYLEELRTAPLQLTNQAHELEVVPYERLVILMSEVLIKRRGKAVGPLLAQKLERTVAWNPQSFNHSAVLLLLLQQIF